MSAEGRPVLPLRSGGLGERARARIMEAVEAARGLFPLAAIDFESSGLGTTTYPIEVGLAVWPAPEAPISTWSRLIRPDAEWLTQRVWQESAEAVHGLRQADLAGGITAAEAGREVARRAGAATLRCDGLRHDSLWLADIACGTAMPRIDDLRDLTVRHAMAMARWRRENPVPHQAGPDALSHLRAFAYALGLKPGRIDDMQPGRDGRTGRERA